MVLSFFKQKEIPIKTSTLIHVKQCARQRSFGRPSTTLFQEFPRHPPSVPGSLRFAICAAGGAVHARLSPLDTDAVAFGKAVIHSQKHHHLLTSAARQQAAQRRAPRTRSQRLAFCRPDDMIPAGCSHVHAAGEDADSDDDGFCSAGAGRGGSRRINKTDVRTVASYARWLNTEQTEAADWRSALTNAHQMITLGCEESWICEILVTAVEKTRSQHGVRNLVVEKTSFTSCDKVTRCGAQSRSGECI
jgi:hypothetical protein